MFADVGGAVDYCADVLLPLSDDQVALFTTRLDARLSLAEAAVGENADNLLISTLFDQTGRSLSLRLVHPQRHRITARDRSHRLSSAGGCGVQAEYLMCAGLPVSRFPRGHVAGDLGLSLPLDARFVRLSLQRRSESDAGDLDSGRCQCAHPPGGRRRDRFKDLSESELVADVRRG